MWRSIQTYSLARLLFVFMLFVLPLMAGGCPDCDAPSPDGGAGAPVTDAGAPEADAGVPEADAGVPEADAGVPVADAGVPEADAGAPEADAGVPEADAGMTDGGGPLLDAGLADSGSPDAGVPSIQASVHHNLKWKRHWQLQQTIMQALGLAEAEVCTELGSVPCLVRPAAERPFFKPNYDADAGAKNPTPVAHRVAMGGHDPYFTQQYKPIPEPGVTTPAGLDRVMWSACEARAQKDAVGSPAVFVGLDLGSDTGIDLSAAATSEAVDALITDLYRRFHQRDPLAAERLKVRELVGPGEPPLTPLDFSLGVCFMIGATMEMVFY